MNDLKVQSRLNVDKRQRMFVQEIPPTGNTLRNSSCSCTRVLVFVHCFDHFNCSALLNCESLVPTCKDGERYVILFLLNVDNCVNCAVCVCTCQHVNTFVSLLPRNSTDCFKSLLEISNPYDVLTFTFVHRNPKRKKKKEAKERKVQGLLNLVLII